MVVKRSTRPGLFRKLGNTTPMFSVESHISKICYTGLTKNRVPGHRRLGTKVVCPDRKGFALVGRTG